MQTQTVQRFGAIFALVVSLIIAGGGYLWVSLGRVEVGLPLAALQQHRGLSNTIQSLSNLAAGLDALRIEKTREHYEEMLLALDIAHAATRDFSQSLTAREAEPLRTVSSEALATVARIEAELSRFSAVGPKRVLALHTRLLDVLAAYTDLYLRVNDNAVRQLTQQVSQIATLRNSTLVATILITLALGAVFWLAWLQRRTITLLRRTENELKLARDEAQQASRAKSEFLASMSHEIRTPMNAILGMLYLTLKSELNPVQFNYLSKVQSAARSLLGIINDILDFSKIEAGKLDIEHVEFELDTVLVQLNDMVGHRAEQRGIEFLVRQAPELPRTLIGDPVRLGQILINLCGNSVKFTEQGEVELAISCVECSDEQALMKFCVRDSGIGMSKEQQRILFRKFSQVDQSITRRYGGTGLGLAISEHLTHLMGGRIWLENSVPGKGSTFCFSLPLGVSSTAERSHRRLIAQMIPKLQGIRALIVDDNEVAREVLRSILEEFRFEVRSVRSAEEALAELQSPEGGKGYDVVLMDWKMPGMHGDEATVRIHRDAAIQPKPKVIMVTAYGRDEVMRVAERAGVDGFLIKPVTPSTLLDAIMAALGQELASRSNRPQQHEVETDTFRGSRVLLVEDNEINREFATELLASFGMEVDHAHNGQVAVARVQQRSYDIVLMDIQMPLMDGYEATQRIRALAQQPGGERFARLPIIAMTAQAMVGDREHALAVGMSDYISKPIDPPQLLTLLKEWLQGVDLAGEPEEDVCRFPEDLMGLKSINAEQGLRRMACNEAAYRKMLLRFHERYADSARGVRGLIAEGHLLEAEHLCHALKGMVGNIGADSLFHAAVEIDEQLKQEQTPADEQLDSFEQLLSQLLEEIAPLLPMAVGVTSAEAVVVDRVELLARLADLKGAIDDDIAEAQELMAGLSAMVAGSEWEDELKAISDRLEEFDTDAAVALTERLQGRLV